METFLHYDNYSWHVNMQWSLSAHVYEKLERLWGFLRRGTWRLTCSSRGSAKFSPQKFDLVLWFKRATWSLTWLSNSLTLKLTPLFDLYMQMRPLQRGLAISVQLIFLMPVTVSETKWSNPCSSGTPRHWDKVKATFVKNKNYLEVAVSVPVKNVLTNRR